MASSTINGLPCRSSSETSQHGGDIRFFIISTSHGFWADLSSPTRIGCSVTHASRHVHAHTGQLKSHIFTITHIFLNLTPILLFIRIFGIIPYIRYKTLLYCTRLATQLFPSTALWEIYDRKWRHICDHQDQCVLLSDKISGLQNLTLGLTWDFDDNAINLIEIRRDDTVYIIKAQLLLR